LSLQRRPRQNFWIAVSAATALVDRVLLEVWSLGISEIEQAVQSVREPSAGCLRWKRRRRGKHEAEHQ
jgi:hypothetical protein